MVMGWLLCTNVLAQHFHTWSYLGLLRSQILHIQFRAIISHTNYSLKPLWCFWDVRLIHSPHSRWIIVHDIGGILTGGPREFLLLNRSLVCFDLNSSKCSSVSNFLHLRQVWHCTAKSMIVFGGVVPGFCIKITQAYSRYISSSHQNHRTL